jgi:hypothetical protein
MEGDIHDVHRGVFQQLVQSGIDERDAKFFCGGLGGGGVDVKAGDDGKSCALISGEVGDIGDFSTADEADIEGAWGFWKGVIMSRWGKPHGMYYIVEKEHS